MLNRAQTRIGANTFHMDLHPQAVVTQEGTAMVAVLLGGKTYAAPSKGEADEVFVGFSTGFGSAAGGDRMFPVTGSVAAGTDPYTGDPVAPSIHLPGTPTTVAIKIAGVAATAGTGAGKYVASGATITFDAADAGKALSGYAVYARPGDEGYNGTVGCQGRVAIIRGGDISTDVFDIEADYSGADDAAPKALYTGPDGKLTTATTGTKIESLAILAAPATNGGFLKVRALG